MLTENLTKTVYERLIAQVYSVFGSEKYLGHHSHRTAVSY